MNRRTIKLMQWMAAVSAGGTLLQTGCNTPAGFWFGLLDTGANTLVGELVALVFAPIAAVLTGLAT